MRFENPDQLKQCITNYGVAHGYQLWYAKNEWKGLLVMCGRCVEEGRCASGNRRKKKEAMLQAASMLQGSVTGKKKGTPVKVKKAVTVKGNKKCKGLKKKANVKDYKKRGCTFRLWASWMQNEDSFQIKSLIPTHQCVRNFDLAPLVTYKWIAKHYAKDIIENPKLTYRAMRDDIKKQFLINVSLGQCQRAKHRSIFDHEGGLREHYARLRDYKDAILMSNPGSSVKLDVDEKPNGDQYFLRMYICFKGIKDGWNGNCRRVIGLDGCFLKSTVKGEILTAMGRDANNQMYPIAWAVVNVENKDNWCWFLAALSEDLNLYNGANLIVISNGHKVCFMCHLTVISI